MAVIKAPVGDMILSMEDVTIEDRKLIVKGKMGLWESRVVVGEKEAWEVGKLLMKGAVIGYFLSLPFKAMFGRLKEEEQTETKLTT